jgi:hypothetical protein
VKVLFISCKTGDYIASCLWDGFQELCGQDNVFDAVDSPLFHVDPPTFDNATSVAGRISATRIGRKLDYSERRPQFDLMVINACFTREHDWHWPITLAKTCLKSEAKIAYVEGWDGSRDINPPNMHVDAIFRRELNPDIDYPYKCHCLMMSAPSRWFNENEQRHLDVFYAAYSVGWNPRWDVCRMAWSTQKRHQSLISSCGIIGLKEYFGYLGNSKLGLCPTGAGGESFDCLRTWEVVANGAIPIFIGLPKRVKEPWFASDECFECYDVNELPGIIDRALDMDLDTMRKKMQANARQNHTTKARAKKILDVLGLS